MDAKRLITYVNIYGRRRYATEERIRLWPFSYWRMVVGSSKTDKEEAMKFFKEYPDEIGRKVLVEEKYGH